MYFRYTCWCLEDNPWHTAMCSYILTEQRITYYLPPLVDFSHLILVPTEVTIIYSFVNPSQEACDSWGNTPAAGCNNDNSGWGSLVVTKVTSPLFFLYFSSHFMHLKYLLCYHVTPHVTPLSLSATHVPLSPTCETCQSHSQPRHYLYDIMQTETAGALTTHS